MSSVKEYMVYIALVLVIFWLFLASGEIVMNKQQIIKLFERTTALSKNDQELSDLIRSVGNGEKEFSWTLTKYE